MKSKGFDLSLKAPDSLPPSSRAKINRALQRVTVLLTAYRSMPGTADNAIVRISVEDLAANPQIKDAVDYFDAMRALFAVDAVCRRISNTPRRRRKSSGDSSSAIWISSSKTAKSECTRRSATASR